MSLKITCTLFRNKARRSISTKNKTTLLGIVLKPTQSMIKSNTILALRNLILMIISQLISLSKIKTKRKHNDQVRNTNKYLTVTSRNKLYSLNTTDKHQMLLCRKNIRNHYWMKITSKKKYCLVINNQFKSRYRSYSHHN